MRLSYLIVGSGYRSKFYARIASTYPSLFRAMFLCRSEEKAALVTQETGIPAVCTPEEGEQFRPDIVVIAVNKASLADVAIEWAGKGYPVLMETPAALTREKLTEIWNLSQNSARIQVAEQYHRYPDLMPGLQAIADGKIGTPKSAYLSLAHDYHGMSLLRRMLQADGELYSLRGDRTMYRIVETDSRTGPVPGNPLKDKAADVVRVCFDSGKKAVYDFSGVQYHSFIRSRHLVVRGDRGEWCDTVLSRVDENGNPVREMLMPEIPLKYRELDTPALRDLRRVWKPDLAMENVKDEFAIASMLYDMRTYIEGGPEVYPLREALDDAYFRILLEEAVADPWKEVKAEKMPWNH